MATFSPATAALEIASFPRVDTSIGLYVAADWVAEGYFLPHQLLPTDRVAIVAAEDRTAEVALEDRTAEVALEDRTAEVPSESTTAVAVVGA